MNLFIINGSKYLPSPVSNTFQRMSLMQDESKPWNFPIVHLDHIRTPPVVLDHKSILLHSSPLMLGDFYLFYISFTVKSAISE